MACIILVEDNTLIREACAGYLQLESYKTIEFGGTDGVLDVIERENADLVILDVMLPDGSGFALAKKIRGISAIPIVFLTAKDSESDRILGFELGADDYICKPFSAKELVLRVKALLKRTAGNSGGDCGSSLAWALEGGRIAMDTAGHLLKLNGTDIHLTGAEWEIFEYLARNAGQVVSREKILAQCLNYFFEGSERTVDTHIANLRQKLKDSGWISTVRGYGYRFNGEPLPKGAAVNSVA
ncbi:response regulator transcription factor [Breznakiella homolactica]|uniref:Response regulator transcription factor n=1 Tax=Breznakiella homolactica TaxID=2798577 RepID=A0A7T7XM23_9SPIR|nr:response regulator transcription factor [Breznakiella homolactica]QQO08728.1 response regulator transcription factor [Breznakiella homolactica]